MVEDQAGNMKFIITGGAGFIGSNLVKFLLRKGHEVIIIDDFSNGKMSNLTGIKKKVRIIKSSILNLSKYNNIIKDVDCLFHLAAKTSVVESNKKPKKYFHVNYKGTKAIIQFIKKLKIKKIIFSASASCYGNPIILPIDEKAKINPLSPYAISKNKAEKYIKTKSLKNNFHFISFRMFNIFGQNTNKESSYTSVITNFLKMYKKNLPLTINGDGNQTRDFLHVNDLCECFYMGAISKKKNRIYNLGSGKRLSIIKLAKMISNRIIFRKEIKNEIRHSQSNISKVTKELAWKPKISVNKGLKNLIKKF